MYPAYGPIHPSCLPNTLICQITKGELSALAWTLDTQPATSPPPSLLVSDMFCSSSIPSQLQSPGPETPKLNSHLCMIFETWYLNLDFSPKESGLAHLSYFPLHHPPLPCLISIKSNPHLHQKGTSDIQGYQRNQKIKLKDVVITQ